MDREIEKLVGQFREKTRYLLKKLSHSPSFFKHAFHKKSKYPYGFPLTQKHQETLTSTPIPQERQLLAEFKNEALQCELEITRVLPDQLYSLYFKNQEQEEEWFFVEQNLAGLQDKISKCIDKILTSNSSLDIPEKVSKFTILAGT